MISSCPVRPRVSDDLASQVAQRITPRDRQLCHVLWDHQVLTTSQIAELGYDNLITCQHRLTTLYRLRVLDRFRHFRPTGSDPYHYVLDVLGARLVAADRALELPKADRRRLSSLALADSQRLQHLLGVNGFFCSMAGSARKHADRWLEEWWSERRCVAEWGEVVRPDGFGVWRCDRSRVEFFLELDRGTEPLARVASKLSGYRDLATATGWHPWLLFWFPTPRREAGARRLLDARRLPVSTGCEQLGRPYQPVWLPLGQPDRVALDELAALPVGESAHA